MRCNQKDVIVTGLSNIGTNSAPNRHLTVPNLQGRCIFVDFRTTATLSSLLTALVYSAPSNQQARSADIADGRCHAEHCFERTRTSESFKLSQCASMNPRVLELLSSGRAETSNLETAVQINVMAADQRRTI